MKFTQDEINVLVDAIDTWMDHGGSELLLHSLISHLASDDPEKAEAETEKRFDAHRETSKSRKIAGTKLKAKLYTMAENDAIDRVLNS